MNNTTVTTFPMELKLDPAEEIEAIIKDVESSWRANDGGLTWAAGDVIGLGKNAIRFIDTIPTLTSTMLRVAMEDWYQSQFDGSTGAESDICFEVCAAIRAELDRRGAPLTLSGLRFRAHNGCTGASSVQEFSDLTEAREFSRSRYGDGWVRVWDDDADRYPREHRGSLFSWRFNDPIEPVGKGCWVKI